MPFYKNILSEVFCSSELLSDFVKIIHQAFFSPFKLRFCFQAIWSSLVMRLTLGFICPARHFSICQKTSFNICWGTLNAGLELLQGFDAPNRKPNNMYLKAKLINIERSWTFKEQTTAGPRSGQIHCRRRSNINCG